MVRRSLFQFQVTKKTRELIWSHGLTEWQLCEIIGLPFDVWVSVRRGIRRPAHNLINELAKILGDEVIFLFLGYYMDDSMQGFVSANLFLQDSIMKKMQIKIEGVKKSGKEFRYL
jgi:hypothetical protein